MKRFILIVSLAVLSACIKNPATFENLKYAGSDGPPLSDSTRQLYYDDAAFLAFGQLIQDPDRRYDQVYLDEQTLLSYYQDLLNIYDKSDAISTTFFEHIPGIHTYAARTLYYLLVSVDEGKEWLASWLNKNRITGIAGIDSVMENYDLEVVFNPEVLGGHMFILRSKVPVNYFALIDKLEKSGEFRYVEPDGIIGANSNISLRIEHSQRIYRYWLGWGDCPSGCINGHQWEIKVSGQEITLWKESGDPLP